MPLPGFLRCLLSALLIAFGAAAATAHPIPDIPVRGVFEKGGNCTIYIEMNPRTVDADPNEAPSLTKAIYDTLPPARKAELERQIEQLARESVEFYLEPVGRIQPEFKWEWTGEGHKPLMNDDDVVVLTGAWKTKIAAGLTGWKIRSLPGKKLAVVFQNFIDGAMHPREAVLFPGETSFTLDLSQLTASTPTAPMPGAVSSEGTSKDMWASLGNYARLGYVHVLPEGMDHILFVVGLYLLSREMRPLLWQITMFTLAHSVTLALATLGLVSAPRAIVEPIIALSIAAVAIENIFHPRYTRWRLVIVFTFGLVHGLGFASGLNPNLPKSSLAVGIVGFNVGVECAQLTVILLCLFITGWIRDSARYRQYIVIPGSALIAAIGLWWAAQRIAHAFPSHQQPQTTELTTPVQSPLS
jgi:hydrogenase/urease accessory protein HupE